MDQLPVAPHSESIRVVVIDDHEMLLDSLVRVLDREPDMTVLAGVGTAAAGLDAVGQFEPSVVVLDYHLPDEDAVATARRITTGWPGVRVLMLTGSEVNVAVFEAARAGCRGYLEKTKAPSELVRMVRSMASGVNEMPAGQLERLPELADLVVHYQPIVRLSSGTTAGFEALVRWNHPTRGLLPPAAFIGLAEQTSCIADIDRRVRQIAFAQAVDWNRRFPTTPPRFMSVNLSGRELTDPDIGRRIRADLIEAGLPAACAMLEVTETFLVDDDGGGTRRLQELRGLGARLALDDFGTGYSSLGYLRRFPIDVIKLDKSFTDELPHGTRGLRLLDAVGRLAADMGALAEAEGIESAEQAEMLQKLGWDLGQGHHFCRPVRAADIDLRLVAEHGNG